VSSSTDDVIDAREQTGTKNRHILNMLRRVAITVTRRPFWSTVGVLLLDGFTKETRDIEVFSGIGFYSRPAPGVRAEAIVAHVGSAENPAIIATRDEDTRKSVAKDVDQDETTIYNTKAIVHVKKNTTIELRAANGVAQKTVLGETYRAAEDTMLAAMSALAAQLALAHAPAGPSPHPGAAAAAAAMVAAITAFTSASATYLSSVAKVQ
jgi:phage gp45-like